MEENKKCCEGKGCEKCEGGVCEKGAGCCGMHGHCGWKKCHGMKHLVWIILIIVAFCLGTQLGELKSEARGGREFRGGMMDWGYKSVKPLTGDVVQTPSTPAPATPAVKQ